MEKLREKITSQVAQIQKLTQAHYKRRNIRKAFLIEPEFLNDGNVRVKRTDTRSVLYHVRSEVEMVNYLSGVIKSL